MCLCEFMGFILKMIAGFLISFDIFTPSFSLCFNLSLRQIIFISFSAYLFQSSKIMQGKLHYLQYLH